MGPEPSQPSAARWAAAGAESMLNLSPEGRCQSVPLKPADLNQRAGQTGQKEVGQAPQCRRSHHFSAARWAAAGAESMLNLSPEGRCQSVPLKPADLNQRAGQTGQK